MGTTPAKPEISNAHFMRVAVERRYVTLGDLRECLQVLAKQDEDAPISVVMLRQGLLTRNDIDSIEAIARSGEIVQRYIERYVIVTKIGEGGMGSVYAVVDPETTDLCAVKVLPDELAEDADLVKRFQREGETACGLRHPNIVCGLRVVEHEGQYFFAMEFVDGETVYDKLERDGVFTEVEALKIVRCICLGLQYAEEKGLVHRDIKPENIMIDRDGTAKLCDMGLVKRLDASRVSRLTQSGMAIGTPHYISPEQARGEENVDHRSDIYALGATLYHMLTGKVPFEGNTAAVIMTKHLTEELDWPTDVNSETSENASRLVSKMMAKERRDRYAHARNIVADIDLILTGRAPSGDALPPGASSIRQAVNIARARDKAAERERERTRRRVTAIHERISRRSGNHLWGMLQQNRQLAYSVAGASGALLLIILAITLGGPADDGLGEMPEPPPRATQAVPSPVDIAITRLRSSAIERIPEVIDTLPDEMSLDPATAARLSIAREEALKRYDSECERRLNAVLASTVQEEGMKDRALKELRQLRATFASSRFRPRIEAAITALEVPPVEMVDAPAEQTPETDESTGREFPPVDMIGAGKLRSWRAYGDWSSQGGVITYRYDPENRYSIAIQSRLGVGEFKLSAEIRTYGGERGEIALWEQGTEDTQVGTPESAVTVSISPDDLKSAHERWARLEIIADASGVTATLARKSLEIARRGPLHHGRIRFSLEGGRWNIRSLEVTPILAEGDVVYERTFDEGDAHGWQGKKLAGGLVGTRRSGTPLRWIDCPPRDRMVESSDGMRLGLVFRADSAELLQLRLTTADDVEYSLRLSGNPLGGKWSALSVPVSDFRSEDGASLPVGSDIASVGVGMNGPQDSNLVLSLLRFVR